MSNAVETELKGLINELQGLYRQCAADNAEMKRKISALEEKVQELIKILISNEEEWKLILLKYEDRIIESQDENEIKKIMKLQKNDLLERYNVFFKQLKQLEGNKT